ncbi:hypothetical protein HK102_005526, partial [Quaeritorhiza haematococci]
MRSRTCSRRSTLSTQTSVSCETSLLSALRILQEGDLDALLVTDMETMYRPDTDELVQRTLYKDVLTVRDLLAVLVCRGTKTSSLSTLLNQSLGTIISDLKQSPPYPSFPTKSYCYRKYNAREFFRCPVMNGDDSFVELARVCCCLGAKWFLVRDNAVSNSPLTPFVSPPSVMSALSSSWSSSSAMSNANATNLAYGGIQGGIAGRRDSKMGPSSSWSSIPYSQQPESSKPTLPSIFTSDVYGYGPTGSYDFGNTSTKSSSSSTGSTTALSSSWDVISSCETVGGWWDNDYGNEGQQTSIHLLSERDLLWFLHRNGMVLYGGEVLQGTAADVASGLGPLTVYDDVLVGEALKMLFAQASRGHVTGESPNNSDSSSTSSSHPIPDPHTFMSGTHADKCTPLSLAVLDRDTNRLLDQFSAEDFRHLASLLDDDYTTITDTSPDQPSSTSTSSTLDDILSWTVGEFLAEIRGAAAAAATKPPPSFPPFTFPSSSSLPPSPPSPDLYEPAQSPTTGSEEELIAGIKSVVVEDHEDPNVSSNVVCTVRPDTLLSEVVERMVHLGQCRAWVMMPQQDQQSGWGAGMEGE